MEMAACVVIALGIFMMLQPFALVLFTWSFVTTLAGVADVHHRLEVSRVARMAEIRVQNLHKAFADFVAVKDSSFTVATASSSACSAPRAAARRRRCA